jgi:ferredoxin-nitrite reductase
LRGGLGKDAAIGKPIIRRVPSAMVEDYVSRLFGSYLERREAGESFAHFCVRSSDDELISIANGNSTGADAAA